MAEIINFPAKTKQPKLRYFITIDEDETPAYASRELAARVIGVIITARTPEEAETLRKEGAAIAKQGQRHAATGGTPR